MANKPSGNSKQITLSLDSWAVLLALIVAAAVRFGVFPKVPW